MSNNKQTHLDEGSDAHVRVTTLVLCVSVLRFLPHVRHQDLDHVLDVKLEARREPLVPRHLVERKIKLQYSL